MRGSTIRTVELSSPASIVDARKSLTGRAEIIYATNALRSEQYQYIC